MMKNSVASAPHIQKVGNALAIASVVAIMVATLLPEPGQPAAAPLCLVCGSDGGVDLVLNIALFIPLGVGLALSGLRWPRAVAFMCGLTVSVEAAQLFFIAGRDASIGDVITNTIGGSLGFALASNSEPWLQPDYRGALRLTVASALVWLAIQAITAFAFALSIPDSQYYGQIARELGDFAVFRGAVLDAGIDGVPIRDTLIVRSDSARRHLLEGGTAHVVAVPAGRTPDFAPILRIADEQEREILLLAQDDQDLVFGVRTGASILRLRPPVFSLPGAFIEKAMSNNSVLADTVTFSGRYNGSEAHLTAGARSASRESRISISPSLGWTLVMPFQWSLQNTPAEFFFSWLWMVLLTVPGGYWGAKIFFHAHAPARVMQVVIFVAGVLAALGAGLILAPLAFGATPAPARDWLAAASGIAIGGALGIRNRKKLPSFFNTATIAG